MTAFFGVEISDGGDRTPPGGEVQVVGMNVCEDLWAEIKSRTAEDTLLEVGIQGRIVSEQGMHRFRIVFVQSGSVELEGGYIILTISKGAGRMYGNELTVTEASNPLERRIVQQLSNDFLVVYGMYEIVDQL